MRPISIQNATKVLIVALAVILSLTNFAEARDRNGDRNHVRRPHFERSHDQRPHRGRQEAFSNRTVDHRYRHDRRPRGDHGYRNDRRHDRFHFDRRHANRGHFEPRYRRDRRHDRGITVREYRGQGRNGWGRSYGDDGFPSEANGGTYFGGLSAWTDPGNGTYFRSEGNSYGYYPTEIDPVYRPARPKIIRVNPSTAGRACSWESGVCVIRR
jgi:hypothetical protein